MTALRLVLVLVALAAAGWLAAAYPGARDQARADALLRRPVEQLAPAQRARALSLLHGAHRGRPDGPANLQEALVLAQTGHGPEAIALLRRLLRSEPDNVTAWTLLGLADPGRAAEARAQQQRLAPPVD